MNDEKTAVINMVSEEIITSTEGVSLFEALCAIEDMGYFESDMEFEDPKHLPPWESGGSELNELVGQNKCAKAIGSANQQIISVLQENELQEDPMTDVSSEAAAKISALDVLQLSRFKPSGSNGGFTIGRYRVKRDDDYVRTQGWGFWMSCWLNTDVDLPLTWDESMLMQIMSVSGVLRFRWEVDAVFQEEKDLVKVVSKAESFDDSVITEAGEFDDCLRLKTVISALGDAGYEGAPRHNMNSKLRRIGTQSIWLAPNVGIVKFLHKHPDDTRTEIELVDYNVKGGCPSIFPLSPGNSWRYEWQDEVAIHREIIRVFPGKEEDQFILSCANHIAEEQNE